MSHKGTHIGTLIKSHGFRGDMLLKSSFQIPENLTKGIALFIEISGQRIPFFIEDTSIDVSGEKCIIKFEYIDSDIETKRYLGCNVYLDIESHPGDEVTRLNDPGFIGFNVVDINSNREYTVADFHDNPGNPILILKRGGDEVLLPGNADYIISVNPDERIIKVQFPEGLELANR